MTEGKRVLVCGGRNFNRADMIHGWLDGWHGGQNIAHIITGGASGADALAREWAFANAVPYTTYPADWKRYGKSAGPRRNEQMLTEGKPDLVIAFPGGGGTADMVDRAEKAGIDVHKVGW